MNFHSLYDQGFARVAAVTLPVHPARPFENAREIIDIAKTPESVLQLLSPAKSVYFAHRR